MTRDNGSIVVRIIVTALVACGLGVLFAGVFFLGGRAFGHDWYPSECCSGRDCKPVVCSDIAETETGFRYDGVDFAKRVERPSQDSRCHVCIREVDRFGLCIFTLQGS